MKPRILNTARLSFPLASSIAALIAAPSALAGNTWDGGGGSGLWSNNTNWNSDTAPSTGVALTFAGNVQNSTSNDLVATDPSFAGILFTNSGAASNTNAFTLAGSRITLGGNITTTANTAGATITDTISLDMILNGNRTITTNQQSASVQHNLTISGVISEDVAGRSLIKAGSGTLKLSGANTYTGATTISGSGGILEITSIADGGNDSSLGKSSNAASNLLIGNTSTLKYTGGTASTDRGFTLNNGAANGNYFIFDSSGSGAINWTNTNSPVYQNANFSLGLQLAGTNTGNNTLAANIANNGTGAVSLTKNGTGTWTLSGANTYTGVTTVSAGTLNITGNRTVASSGFSVIGSTAVVNLSGDFPVVNSIFNLNTSGTFNQTAGALSFPGGASYGGNQLIISTGGTYNLSGGSLTTTGSSGENRGVILSSGADSGTTTFNLSGTGNLNVSNSNGKDSLLDIIRSDGGAATNSNATFNQTGSDSNATVSILRIGGSGANTTGNTANLNLSAGTFTATRFDKLSAGNSTASNINISGTALVTLPALPTTRGTGSSATVNFNGGTLKVGGAGSGSLGDYLANSADTAVNIYTGGVTIHTNGNDTTIAQGMGNPADNALTGITLTNSTDFFTSPTAVTFTGLTGTAPTGYTVLDSNGHVTGMVITNPGSFTGSVTGVTIAGANPANVSYSGATTAANSLGGLTKTGTGTLVLNGTNTYAGVTTVTSGSLVINGAVASTSLVVNGSLGGSGTMANATLSGSGSINPGNSPGILTAANTDPTGGLDYNFEFTAANTLPTWSNASASINDVLRLTDATPFNSALGAPNVISIYINAGALTVGQVFTGGFFTDQNASFLSSINTATFRYLVATGGIGTETYNGQNYDLYTGPFTFGRDTVVVSSADFAGGTVTGGYVSQFTVVPEPGAVLIGSLGLLLLLRRRRN